MTGYESKRAAAQDKLDDNDDLTIAYQSGYYDGKKAAQPAQEPVAHCEAGPEYCVQCKLEDRSIVLAAAVRYVKNNTPQLVSNEICNALKKSSPPQRTEQEPVAWLCKPDQHGLFDPPTPDKACKDCFPVYTTPPQRPWVGMTDEEVLQIRENLQVVEGISLLENLTKAIEAKLKEKNT